MFPGQPHGRFSVLANGELRIRDVRREDEGVYVCSALSVAGSSIAKAELRIALADDRPPPIIRQGETPPFEMFLLNQLALGLNHLGQWVGIRYLTLISVVHLGRFQATVSKIVPDCSKARLRDVWALSRLHLSIAVRDGAIFFFPYLRRCADTILARYFFLIGD